MSVVLCHVCCFVPCMSCLPLSSMSVMFVIFCHYLETHESYTYKIQDRTCSENKCIPNIIILLNLLNKCNIFTVNKSLNQSSNILQWIIIGLIKNVSMKLRLLWNILLTEIQILWKFTFLLKIMTFKSTRLK